MVRCVFEDFDQFADAISGLDGRYIPTARSQCEWWIDPLRVGALRLQQLQVGGPATFVGDGDASSGLTVGIPVHDQGAIRIDGQLLDENSFILIRRDRPLTYSAHGPTRWAGVTVPAHLSDSEQFKDAAEWSGAMLGETLVQAEPALLRRVSLLVALLCSGNEMINIADRAAVAAAEEEILLAVAQLLRGSSCIPEHRSGRPPFDRDRVIARCLEFLRENTGQAILVSELCRIAGVSERTLRNVFYEYFGVGPVRFLKARQLQEVRAALLASDAAHETVTAIATRFGVWDFSAFSRNYRALYGESPSQTRRLGRRHVDTPMLHASVDSMRSWMQYASLRFAHAHSS